MVKGLIYIIINDSTCQTLIGQNAAADTYKVYPVIATQEEISPLVTVFETGRKPEFCRGQRSTTFNYSYEIHVFSDDYDKSRDILNAIIDAVENKSVRDPINGVVFTDRIRNIDAFDKEYIEAYKLYHRVGLFEAPTNEDQST